MRVKKYNFDSLLSICSPAIKCYLKRKITLKEAHLENQPFCHHLSPTKHLLHQHKHNNNALLTGSVDEKRRKTQEENGVDEKQEEEDVCLFICGADT